jgi:hypothetical protein
VLCDRCGKDNPPENKYCGECGSKLIREETAGPVSSAFRREVAQQELRLQRINESTESYSKLATPPVENAGSGADHGNHPVTSADESATGGEDDYSQRENTGHAEPPISGPSFLGLNVPEANSDLSYLCADEPRPRRVRKIVAVLMLLGFAAFIGYEWKQNPSWRTRIVGRVNAAIGEARNSLPGHRSTANSPAGPNQSPPSETQAQNNPAATTSNQTNAGSQQSTSPQQPKAAQHSASSQPANGMSLQTSDQQNLSAQQEAANINAPAGVEHQTAKVDNSAPGTAPIASRQGAYEKPEQPDSDLIAKADAYLYGRGVPRNCQQALAYLRTAANEGSPDARSKLGGLYATGNCVRLDRAEAYNWFTLARDAGSRSVWLERNRQMLWDQMTQAEKARVLQPLQ